jgi:signal transduction histidine kinase
VAYAEVDADEDNFTILGDYTRESESIAGRHRLVEFGDRCLLDLRAQRTHVLADTQGELGPDEAEAYRAIGVGSLVCVPLHKAGRFVAGLATHSATPRQWAPEEVHLIEMVAERCWADLERARADRKMRDLNLELETRVQERTAELLEANREMEGFTYTVSHDLRAPLRAITATSMILLEEASEKLASEERALLERQAHNAKHLGVLIDELLKLSRISRQEMTRSRFSLSALAAEVVKELEEDGAGTVGIEIEPDLWTRGDPKLVRFILLNLFENACKFSPEGGTIRFGTLNGAFFVKDEGIGFDPRYIDKLFRPFERLVNQSEYPGTGIGLANVKRIVDRHGGQVWAESAPGQGATFWFTLGPGA